MIDPLDLHTHTTASGHAYSFPYEVARSALERGMRVFGYSDHALAMSGIRYCYHLINFKVIPKILYDMELMMGIELNIMGYEGEVDLEQDLFQSLDYAIASLHRPCIESGIIAQNTNIYLGAMKNPTIHIMGRPDDSRCPADYGTLVSAARERKTLLEANNSPLNPMSFRQGIRESYLKILELHKYCKAPITMDSGAHCEVGSGGHTFAHTLLEEVSFPPELVVNTSLDLPTGYIFRLTSTPAQPDDARCGQAGRDVGNTALTGGTASAEDIASARGTGK